MKINVLVLTCEHAGNQIPKAYSYLFRAAEADLENHQGWDPGALFITRSIAAHLGCEYHYHLLSRLLVEVNRSVGHPALFSTYTKSLSPAVRRYLIENYYKPYRKGVTGLIREKVDLGLRVVHLSVHTFTPAWEGKQREVEIGLLFDEERQAEKSFCEAWAQHIQSLSGYRVLFNQPYKGADDGFTTYLRTKFTGEQYLGLELEVSQKFVNSGLEDITKVLCTTLEKTFS